MHIQTLFESTEIRAAIASELGVSQQAISNWRVRGIPDGQCPGIERATGGLLTCEIMRPDLTWVRVNDMGWPHESGRPLLDRSTTPTTA
jgi:DNA-binding transcriptional regulator YdaS (Cro superfamily)